jgi:hypothetical protein
VRITLTLDPDIERRLEEETQRSHKPFDRVVNEALRRGLGQGYVSPSQLVLNVHQGRLRSGYDSTSFNALSDELEDVAALGPAAKTR